MKITKRSLFILVPLVAVVGTAGVLQFRKSPANTRTAQVQKQSIPQAAQQATSPVTIAAEETTPTPPTPMPAPAPVAPPPAPIYGEDPNNPGVFVVFDKEIVMNQAGVPADQQTDANTLISKRLNWRYKVAGSPDANLCGIAPIVKMATAGTDYLTNPVTQLNWCNQYAQGHYGSWAAALANFNKYSSF